MPKLKTFYCPYCGKTRPAGATFCPYCGHRLDDIPSDIGSIDNDEPSSKFSSYINDYVGNDSNSKLNWKVLFTDIFKHHSAEDGDAIFICGTSKTTPPENEVSSDWPHPWLYARVFLTFLIAYIILFLGCDIFGNINLLPGLIIVGALIIPLSSVMLFTELNVFRNVSMYRICQVFLLGGTLSLLFTLVLFSIITPERLDWSGAFITGIVEEIGKGVIIYFILRRMNASKILVGLLIGATVGAGLAAFETAGYSLRIMLASGWESMLQTIFVRNLLSPGGHIAWGAVTGASIIIACKDSYTVENIFSLRFLKLFAIPVVLHFLWDSPLSLIGADFFLVYIILIIVVWAFTLSLIDRGLDETRIKR